jgi:4-amino-4-deoxy-L-arabinose transferase-like glycosyltransferase
MRNYIVIFLGCLLLHVAGTWSLPLIDRDEPRFAEASREMRERGDYIIPYFNNEFRFDKPPLTYWFQIASYRIFGENDFAARFPTVVAAALVALVVFAWGKRVRDVRVGRWAAIIFTLSLQTFIHGKAAVADMWLVLFVTLAHRAGWELLDFNAQRQTVRARLADNAQPRTGSGLSNGERSIGYWWALFYVSLALAFLAKGPIGWTPLLTVAIAQSSVRQECFAARFKFVRGVLLMLALVCLWGIPALVQTHGEFFRIGIGKHVIERSIVTMEGHGASSIWMYLALLPFYFIGIFVSFFPWSIKLPALWKNLRAHRDATDQFLLAGTLIVFGIFTFVQTKLPHYTLPAFPLLALLVARRFDCLRLSKSIPIAMTAIYVAIALFVAPYLAKLFPSYTLARDSRPNLKPEMEFGAVDFTEPSLVWYFRDRIHGFMMPLKRKEAAEFMSRPSARFVVLPTASVNNVFPNVGTSWRSYRAKGLNVAKGRRVDLTMLVKADFVIPSVSRGIPQRDLKGNFNGIPRLTLGATGY